MMGVGLGNENGELVIRGVQLLIDEGAEMDLETWLGQGLRSGLRM